MRQSSSTIDIDAARAYHRAREERRRAEREAHRQEWLARSRQVILRLAPQYPSIQRVYLFGSLTQPGRFGARSDIDVAVECDDLKAESAFWSALEQALRRDVDLRPLTRHLVDVVALTGELVYER